LTTTNKRKHPRVKITNLISYVCIDDSGNETEQGVGKAINISLGGILIETHKPITSQNILLMVIGIQDELIYIKGRIVYCNTGDSGMFRTGIQFLESDEKIQSYVKSIVKVYSKQKI